MHTLRMPLAVFGLVAASAVASAIGFQAIAHADSYKQAFSTPDSLFKVAGDESSISYALDVPGATLACHAYSGPQNGSWVTVANLSQSGTITSSAMLPAGMYCSPNITSLAQLIQAMREGSIRFVSGSTDMALGYGDVNAAFPMMAAPTSTSTSTTGMTGTTASSTMQTATSSTSTASTSMAIAPTGATGLAGADVRVALNNLLREHVASSIAVLHDISDNSPALAGSLQEQDQNAVDLASLIAAVYGKDAGATFLQEFRAHIADSNAYTEGVKSGSVTDQTAALAALDMQLQNLSHFFANANPNIPYDALLASLRQHEILVNTSSDDYAKGDYTGAYAVERQALAQISGGADFLSGAIVAQYPGTFTK